MLKKNMKTRIGIIGCGAVAYRWYLKGLSINKRKDYEIVVVCDIDERKARKAAEDFAVPNYCTSLNDLLKHNLDLAVILTRHNDHFAHTKFCLQNGMHVYSEKPFAMTVKEGRELLALAKKAKKTIGCAPQVMLSSRNRKVKQLLGQGKIGEVAYVRASCSNLGPAGRADTNYDPVWFYNEGGSLSSLGIYGLSTLIWLMGKPQRVSSFEGISMPRREVLYGPFKGKEFSVTAPDNVIALFNFGKDKMAVFDGSYSVTTPPLYELEIHGTKGSLFVGGFGGPDSIKYTEIGKQPVAVGPDDDCHIRWTLAWGVEETVRAIHEDREPATSASFALQVLEVMEAMERSSKLGKHISLRKDI